MCKHSGMGMNRCVWGPRLTFMISSSAHHLYFWRQGFSLVLSSCTELDCLANELQGSTCVYSSGVGLQELPTTSRSPSFWCGAEDSRSLCTNWAISPALYSYVIAKMHDRSSVKAAHKHTPLVHSGKAVKWKKKWEIRWWELYSFPWLWPVSLVSPTWQEFTEDVCFRSRLWVSALIFLDDELSLVRGNKPFPCHIAFAPVLYHSIGKQTRI